MVSTKRVYTISENRANITGCYNTFVSLLLDKRYSEYRIFFQNAKVLVIKDKSIVFSPR